MKHPDCMQRASGDVVAEVRGRWTSCLARRLCSLAAASAAFQFTGCVIQAQDYAEYQSLTAIRSIVISILTSLITQRS